MLMLLYALWCVWFQLCNWRVKAGVKMTGGRRARIACMYINKGSFFHGRQGELLIPGGGRQVGAFGIQWCAGSSSAATVL
jgi:hypothetical protein